LAAIELAENLDPDAVVIDLHMPLLDGVTAAARLRRDHPNLCLIALTGDEAPALHRAVREAGADEVLLKNELVEGLVDRLATIRPSEERLTKPSLCPRAADERGSAKPSEVARAGIEPATPRFSAVCSTN